MRNNLFILIPILAGMFLGCTSRIPRTVKTKTENTEYTEKIPDRYAMEESICLKMEWVSRGNTYFTTYARLINPTSSPITFTGYSESSPWYKIQKLVDGQWVDHEVGWFCGTGLRECTLPPGKSSLIQFSVDDDLYPVRIGVGYKHNNKKEIVWSEMINKTPKPENIVQP